jgi:hypothetical protein
LSRAGSETGIDDAQDVMPGASGLGPIIGVAAEHKALLSDVFFFESV